MVLFPSSARLRKKRFILGLILSGSAIGGAVWFFLYWQTPHVSGPLRQEVYVWQRAWTKPVRDAVTQHATNFAALAVLRAEISWTTNRQPQLTRANVDYETLARLRRPVGFALRIGTYAGPFTNDAVATFITATAARLVAEVRTNHVPLAELQIDFDCAESKLDGYRVWIEAIQRRIAPLPVTITALPSWLDSRAFRRLAAGATNYVLQVHSAVRPRSAGAPYTLCDPQAARRAVETAGRLGIPFRVALPTYGYLQAFYPNDNFLGHSAEGPRPNWPTNTLIRKVESNALELSELIRDWTAHRPATMNGVIWYRLPVASDKHNWPWPMLQDVMRGD